VKALDAQTRNEVLKEIITGLTWYKQNSRAITTCTPETVVVSLNNENHKLILRVVYSGPGIPAEEREEVFKRF